ncbi:MAG: hypothetical protein IKX83_01270 [Clostridia bacterium]|nr:hypothetical protein [Clostridia bacterium]
MISKKTSYPVILVPGVVAYGDDSKLTSVFPYFGTMSASVEKTIRSLDIDCFTASFRPTSGIWERTCELYAQIKGGTVDYGADHAARTGTPRFGKTYPGFVPTWNTTNEFERYTKVTLIAHGFGAPVARMLAYLMANGSEREQEASAEELSPLFAGGNSKAVHAVVTLGGNNDGTTLVQALESMKPGVSKTLANLAFKLDGEYYTEEDVDDYLAQTRSNLFYELGLDGMADFNRRVEPSPDTYYIAYSAEATRDYARLLPERKIRKYENPFTSKAYRRAIENRPELTLPDLKHGGLAVAPTAAIIGTFKNYLSDAPLATPVLHANDGLINTDNTLAPSTEPARAYKSVDDCYPGEWYQMPIEEGNSLDYLGVFQRPDKYRDFYIDLMKIVCNLID